MKSKKIDFHAKGKYLGTTTSRKTCKDAKKMYLEMLEFYIKKGYKLSEINKQILKDNTILKANFQKD